MKKFSIEYYQNHKDEIPKDNGVYFIYCKNCKLLDMEEKDLDRFNKTDKKLLYIGKAEGKNGGLRKRLGQYLRNASNHKGGRDIWNIKNASSELYVTWIVYENAERLEKMLISIYKKMYGVFPYANKKI